MVSIRRILCPIDFSLPAEAALKFAETIARPFGAQLVVAHVVEPMNAPLAYNLPSVTLVKYEEEVTASATEALAPLIRKVKERGGRARAVVTTGLAAERICELARDERADLVVLATHGYGGMKRMLLGSTAERVVRHCPCPVLTIRSAGDATGGVPASPRARSRARSGAKRPRKARRKAP